MEQGKKSPLIPNSRRSHCPVFGVESGGPITGLGILVFAFGGVLLLTGRDPLVTVPPALLFSGFGLVLVILGLRK
ncbi:MAG: hypothetical protein NQU46_06805 [Methanolinea sp.]|nr:hypothetical protein [Methanolinea sp.]